ncbi:pyruvate kinase [uncultured Tessaracoccus sp.]|uniref:pyruvate kinase n=1 Tax=uncultured Tessaracoccus sp. TaxID=905023 RepID=UPI0025F5E6DB|nr:pyruvate kinase [uncultured Tessaracoccus sp.]
MSGAVVQRARELRGRVQEYIDGAVAAQWRMGSVINNVRPVHRASAINLVHYVWLRGHDIRGLQAELADLGLSSLGRLESRVLPTLYSTLNALGRLAGDEPIGLGDHDMSHGPELLRRNARRLLGPEPHDRVSRIMVTFPSEAAHDPELVKEMVAAGTDVARINCAHDGPREWAAMIEHLHAAQPDDVRDRCRVSMDLAGPKLRTGPIAPGPRVVKVRPERDEVGRVLTPASVTLCRFPAEAASRHTADIPVGSVAWLRALQEGERIAFVDARGSRRELVVRRPSSPDGWPRVVCDLARTAYVVPGTELASAGGTTVVDLLPPTEQHHLVRVGEVIHLLRDLAPQEPVEGGPHRVGCSLPQVFEDAGVGDRVWFDDGKVGGRVVETGEDRLVIEVTQAGPNGAKLRAEKGINLPDTHLGLPALTDDDIAALPFVVEHADAVNYSFVRTPEDVADLFERVRALGRDDLDVVLKIENVEAFQNLPQILLEAMRWKDIGVMIARGDLAVEAGFERLAEVQEEILWLCEAAHVPVIWATQVLESMAKKGMPSRAEVTDAAMSERAECVMLNKGPFIVEAIRFLHDVLWRMRNHVDKKRTLLRRLRAWDLRQPAPRPVTHLDFDVPPLAEWFGDEA